MPISISEEVKLLRAQKYGGVLVIANLQNAQRIREKYGWNKVVVLTKAEHIVHLGKRNMAVVDHGSANPLVLDYAKQKNWTLVTD